MNYSLQVESKLNKSGHSAFILGSYDSKCRTNKKQSTICKKFVLESKITHQGGLTKLTNNITLWKQSTLHYAKQKESKWQAFILIIGVDITKSDQTRTQAKCCQHFLWTLPMTCAGATIFISNVTSHVNRSFFKIVQSYPVCYFHFASQKLCDEITIVTKRLATNTFPYQISGFLEYVIACVMHHKWDVC